MSNHQRHTGESFVATTLHRFSVLVILAWLAIIVGLAVGVPTLEQVEAEHAVSLNPPDAPSIKAMERMTDVFEESGTGGSAVMIVLEGQQPLGEEAHQYYEGLIRQLRNDPKHVQRIQDFWGDELTRGAAQSDDGKAAYVQVTLAGKPGDAESNESVEAVRHLVAQTPLPPGVKAYVTGGAAIAADMGKSGNSTVVTITLISLAVIFLTLLLVYRSIVTVILLLVVVGMELQVARGFVALLGHFEFIGLTTFAVNLMVALVIAAGTDYGIFFIGRYHEARLAGEDRETAFYTTYRGVAKVVLASGLTIAGATYCLSFTRLPSFQALGVPCAVGILVAVAVALTLVPAVLVVGGRFGLLEPKRNAKVRGWRRIGTAVVRWPGPVLVATLAVALLGLLILPGFKPDYNDQHFLPKDIPANEGIAAASRHFPQSAGMPEILMVETDHDLRNPADFLVLNKLAKAVLAVPGVEKVQAATRPEGTPVAHATIPYLLSAQQAGQQQFMYFQKQRMEDLLVQADQLGQTIGIMQNMYGLMQQMSATMHGMVKNTHEMQEITNDMRDHIADFDDFIRPIRNYFYWEPHCYDIPICYSVRSLFDVLDGVDTLTDKLKDLVGNLDQMDAIMPQLINQFPEMIAIMQSMRSMLLTMHSTMSGVMGQMDDSGGNSTAMGKAFDAAQNDDSFYAPPEIFKNADFQRVMKIFLSPDGKAVRMIVTQKGDPTSPEATARVDAMRNAAEEALKGTPLEGSPVSVTGTAALVKDLVEGTNYDLLIAVVAALCLIFMVMLFMTRSLIAAMVIVGTILLSLGSSFGLAVFVWQYLLGIPLHWSVFVMTVIVLLAVGSDYNLLLVTRMKEEVGAGLNTGIIRAMVGTGKVVTTAGLVFAFTMASMIASNLVSLGQVGTTIALGLLFDTLIVRAFMTPSIAALLGRWFWWPQKVRPRPASSLLRPTGPRPLVRALLLDQQR
jgi:putative drug exporter of the RND superfamily